MGRAGRQVPSARRWERVRTRRSHSAPTPCKRASRLPPDDRPPGRASRALRRSAPTTPSAEVSRPELARRSHSCHSSKAGLSEAAMGPDDRPAFPTMQEAVLIAAKGIDTAARSAGLSFADESGPVIGKRDAALPRRPHLPRGPWRSKRSRHTDGAGSRPRDPSPPPAYRRLLRRHVVVDGPELGRWRRRGADRLGGRP
jgi:hypothetical protein